MSDIGEDGIDGGGLKRDFLSWYYTGSEQPDAFCRHRAQESRYSQCILTKILLELTNYSPRWTRPSVISQLCRGIDGNYGLSDFPGGPYLCTTPLTSPLIISPSGPC